MNTVFSEINLNRIEYLIRESGKYMLTASDIECDNELLKQKSNSADFVTVFDEGVQERLIKGILEIFPFAKFFAEEKENFAEDTENGLCFVIDPIDGTANFIHELKMSSISVAGILDGEAVFGSVYNPYNDELFIAVKGQGAYLNGKKINVSERELQFSLISFGTSPYKKSEYADVGFEIAKAMFNNCGDIRRSGSAAIDMANVACGRLDGFFECILSPWDYAAGYVLITEAGGKVTDFDGDIVSFNSPSPLLCSNGFIHNKLKALIDKLK